MSNLIKAELFKLSKSNGYKILIFCAFVLGMIYGITPYISGSDVTGFYLLSIMPGFVLFHSMLASMFTAVFICSEFTNRTYGMSFFCGVKRRSAFISKLVVFFTGLFPLLLTDVIISTVVISLKNGFGKEFSIQTCKEIFELLFLYLITSLAMGGFFVLIASAIKNAVATISTAMGMTYVLMYLTTNYKDSRIMKYIYVYQFNQFLEWESAPDKLYIWTSVVSFVLTIFLSVYFFEKRDLR